MKINFSQEENLLKNLATTLCNTKGEQTVCMYFNSLCVIVIHDFMIDSVGSYFRIAVSKLECFPESGINIKHSPWNILEKQ